MLKSWCKAQLTGTCFGSVLNIMAILLFVQVQMAGPSPHSVSLCDKESFALHCLQVVVSNPRSKESCARRPTP